MNDITKILSALEAGESAASDELLPLVYDELRKLAGSKLAREHPGQTLQATALVHDAYIRLVGAGGDVASWNSRGHFFGAAAEAMRRILVERARRKKRIRHGGGLKRVDLDEGCSLADPDPDEILDLNEALSRLESMDPIRARLVKLRFFAGLTIPDAAQAMGISRATAERHWTFARTWLFAEMAKDEQP